MRKRSAGASALCTCNTATALNQRLCGLLSFYLMISMYSLSLPLLSLHLRYMTDASTLAGEKVLGSFSREITLRRMVLNRHVDRRQGLKHGRRTETKRRSYYWPSRYKTDSQSGSEHKQAPESGLRQKERKVAGWKWILESLHLLSGLKTLSHGHAGRRDQA